MKTLLSLILISSALFSTTYSQGFRPGDHELIMFPTAYTMPQGNSYFTDYELFLLNYTYAITNRTHIGVFTMFPMVKEFYNTVTFGVKQNYLRFNSFQSAFYFSFTVKGGGIILGNAFSFGEISNGVTVNIFYMGSLETSNDNNIGFSLGYRIDPTENTSVLGELSYGMGGSEGVLFTLGFRLRSKHLSWEIGATRPLDSDFGSDILAIPLLKATYYFF
jgi:hypothetical protein